MAMPSIHSPGRILRRSRRLNVAACSTCGRARTDRPSVRRHDRVNRARCLIVTSRRRLWLGQRCTQSTRSFGVSPMDQPSRHPVWIRRIDGPVAAAVAGPAWLPRYTKPLPLPGQCIFMCRQPTVAILTTLVVSRLSLRRYPATVIMVVVSHRQSRWYPATAAR